MPALSPEQIAAENTAARSELETHFGATRWPKLCARARERGFTDAEITELCGDVRRTRKHFTLAADNDAAALALAANGFVIEIGGRPSPEDEAALQTALSHPQAPAS